MFNVDWPLGTLHRSAKFEIQTPKAQSDRTQPGAAAAGSGTADTDPTGDTSLPRPVTVLQEEFAHVPKSSNAMAIVPPASVLAEVSARTTMGAAVKLLVPVTKKIPSR